MSESRNLLCICRHFPPERGSAVQRPAKFVKYLGMHGWRPWVVSARPSSPTRDEELARELPADVEAARTWSLDPGVLMPWSASGLVLRTIERIYAAVYLRTAFPDWSAGWAPFAVLAGWRLLRRHRFSAIYVHSQPQSSFLAGVALQRISGLPLVVDYDDPWTCTPTHFPEITTPKLRLVRRLEAWVLRRVTRVVYCKESILTDIRTAIPDVDTAKFSMVTNGYDACDFDRPAPVRTDGRLRLVYTGRVSRRFCYSPDGLLRGLRMVLDRSVELSGVLEVVIAGIVDKECGDLVSELGLAGTVIIAGYVDHARSVGLIRGADALILLMESARGPEWSQRYAGSMPSKVFEYLYAAKPVLAVAAKGPEVALLNRAGCCYQAAPNDPASVCDALTRLVADVKMGAPRAMPEWVGEYDRRFLTAALARVLDSAVDGRAPCA